MPSIITSTAGTPDSDDFAKDEVENVYKPWYRDGIEDTNRLLYPMCLGEVLVLSDRYLAERKLGFGGGSTVLMAFDLHDKKNVALKTMALGRVGTTKFKSRTIFINKVLYFSPGGL